MNVWKVEWIMWVDDMVRCMNENNEMSDDSSELTRLDEWIVIYMNNTTDEWITPGISLKCEWITRGITKALDE